MDSIQTSLPDVDGADIDGVKVGGAIAFAEDLVLTASTDSIRTPSAFEQSWRFRRIMRHVRVYGEIFFCVSWNGASAEEDHCRSRHVSLNYVAKNWSPRKELNNGNTWESFLHL